MSSVTEGRFFVGVDVVLVVTGGLLCGLDVEVEGAECLVGVEVDLDDAARIVKPAPKNAASVDDVNHVAVAVDDGPGGERGQAVKVSAAGRRWRRWRT